MGDYQRLLSQAFQDQTNITELSKDDPRFVIGKRIESLFTLCVGALRTFPQEDVRQLMVRAWDAYNKRVVAVAIAPAPFASLAVMRQMGQDTITALVILPPDWAESMRADYLYTIGGIISVSSRAVDFAEGALLVNPEIAEQRALAYEAEYLRQLRKDHPDWKPNAYQEDVMAKFPEGTRTPSITQYIRRGNLAS